MDNILARFPGARRALFSHFHIGGCQSCSYKDEESLADVCARNEIPVEKAVDALRSSHEHDMEMLLAPSTLKQKLDSTEDVLLMDMRTREEHEAVKITGSEFLTEERQNALFGLPPETTIVLYDHTGRDVLDRCSWFRGHGMKRTFGLQGGIDAWSKEVDSSVQRYRLEMD